MALTANRPLNQGLVLDLRFSEGVGTKTFDASKYQNHGTIAGASWTDGKYGKALSFDGINNYVEVVDAPSLDITDKFTVVSWVKPNTMVGDNFVYTGLDGVAMNGFAISIYDDVVIRILLRNNITNEDYTSSAKITLNVWNHIVATYDAENNIYALYINGVLDISGSVTFNITSNAINKKVGNANWGNVPFYGVIDEVRIYNRVLTLEEIKLLYAMRGLA